jgi:hypothetical protein
MKASWRMRMKFKDVRDGLSGPGSGPLAGKAILAPSPLRILLPMVTVIKQASLRTRRLLM